MQAHGRSVPIWSTTQCKFDVIEGESTVITAQDVDNGSSDNCGEIALSVSPSSFSTSDVGLQSAVLTVTDANDNTSTCTCVVSVDNVTGMEETAMAARIRVLPNPTNGHFQLDLSELTLSADTRVDITDALGRTVFGTNPTKSILDLDLGHLPDGAYTVRLSDPDGKTHVTSTDRTVGPWYGTGPGASTISTIDVYLPDPLLGRQAT
jgi:hypothetical protein